MKYARYYVLVVFAVCVCVCTPVARAATLSVSPNTGVYTAGGTFTLSILLNTQQKSVNAADGQLSFNPKELQVVSVSRSNSIFNLWTQEPSFSNTAGTISFGGGSPTGYTGARGTVMTITMKALASGAPKVSFKTGSVLAADGLGTNILTSMSGGTFTVSAQSSNPEPEYVAPANTPAAPRVVSTSHPDEAMWYKHSTAELSWELPADVIAVRLLLDDQKATIPTVVYDEPISKKTLEDLPNGTSYFHIQFKNNEGWGRVAHYALRVDMIAPTDLTVREDVENAPPGMHRFILSAEDISPIQRYRISFDGAESVEFKDIDVTGTYDHERLTPGNHTMLLEAYDAAGNVAITTHTFAVETFEAPVFTNFPLRITPSVVPILEGTSRPRTQLQFEVTRASDGMTVISFDDAAYYVNATDDGVFRLIPPHAFDDGVYTVVARARDERGMQSDVSHEISFVVEPPAYVQFGHYAISFLSVVIPLLALIVSIIIGGWFTWHKVQILKSRIRKETAEAERTVNHELDTLMESIESHIAHLRQLRKGKKTEDEIAVFEQLEHNVTSARQKINKEMNDIDRLIS